MNKRNVDSSLQIKARRYLEYVNQQEKRAYQKGESILSSLSSSLRAEILKSIYYKTFKKDIPFFADNFSDDCIDSLMLRAKEVSFAPEELIFRQNEIEDPCLYFIIKGKVEIYLDLKRVFLQMTMLSQGKTFGEKEFVLGSPREFSVRSLECSRLIYITRKDFLEVLKSFPDDNEKFLMIKDRIVFDSGNTTLNETCYFCDSRTHNIVKCPFLGYHPKQQLLLGNWFHSTQKRRRCFRPRVFKTNSLKKKRVVVLCAGKYQDPQAFQRKNQEFFEENNERLLLQKNVSYEVSHQENDPQTMILDNEEFFMKASMVESRKPSFIQRKILEIDKGKNYKCYFPWDNVDQFVINLKNPENIAKKIYGKTKRRMTSPRKAGLLASALADSRRASSFSKANLLINKGCLWFKKQWPFKSKH